MQEEEEEEEAGLNIISFRALQAFDKVVLHAQSVLEVA